MHFQRTSVSFALRQSIFSPLVQAEAAFGSSVALKDSTLLVGCPGAELKGQRQHGGVFVFRRETNTWRNVAEVFRPSGSAGEFGTTVAFGSNWLAAGSRYSNASTNLSDRVAIWRFGPPGGELSAAQRPGMGDFQVSASGELGHTYYFQAATNLAAPNWTDLFPFTLAMPSTNLTDTTTAIGPQRFYRLRSETNAPVP